MGTLRTLLALSVVFNHSAWGAGYVFVGGPNAVQLFYMISGFVITHVLTTVPRYAELRTFYASRALRLYPVYYAVAALALAWLVAAQRDFFDVYRAMPASAAAFLTLVNGTLFGQDWVLFLGVRDGHLAPFLDFRTSPVQLWQGLIVPPAWTLGVELGFYLVAPFLVRRPRLAIGVLALSLAARAVAIAQGWGAQDPWTYRFLPFELALFLTGMVAYQHLLPAWKRLVPAAHLDIVTRTATWAAWLACAGYFLVPLPESAKRLAVYAIVALIMPLAFLYQRRSRLDQWVGELSYPLYVGHYLVMWVCTAAFAHLGPQAPAARVALYVAAALAFAVALNHGIARPVERRRTLLRGQPRDF